MIDKSAAPSAKRNRVGLSREAYKGAVSTLCAGCGHNSITNHLIKALYESSVEPHLLTKVSGIGCSSKTPTYFVDRAFGFNGVHGRMPSVATGVGLANRQLIMLGISGDGDTASIGLGQFCHLVRRNARCVYIIEDNGTYGLTKGQFSATADIGSVQKRGTRNEFQPIDLCALALQLGATFVARSFSGDGKQLVPLIKTALVHPGIAVLDVISPCVTFNDHEGSTKSYEYLKEHDEVLQDLSFIPYYDEIQIDYPEGSATDITLHDGSHLLLRKLGPEHDPRDRIGAMQLLAEAQVRDEVVTGLLYIDPDSREFCELENLVEEPLASLGEAELRPSRDVFEALISNFA